MWGYNRGITTDREEKADMTFAERLAQARQESGLTQDALAGMLDVSRQTVSKWESGVSLS